MTCGWGRVAPREGTDADFWQSADEQAAKDATLGSAEARERREAEQRKEREDREADRGKR